MKYKLWILVLIASVLFLNCGEKEVKSIDLEDAIFRAKGNNPSWKLEIDANNGIHFNSNSKLDKIITQSSKIIEIMNVAATSYHATTDSVEIKIEIFRKQCIDSKTNKETKYEVRVSAKNNDDNDFTIFKGCGEFLTE